MGKNKPIGQRFEMREKKRRANTILNILIGVAIVLILCIGWSLFFATGESEKTTKQAPSVEKEKASQSVEKETAKPKEEKKEEPKTEEKPEPVDGKVMVTDIQDSSVLEAYTNPSWKPIGTSQTEPHVTKFDSKSADWTEMLQAAAYATDLTPSDIFPQRISNGGAPNKVNALIGTKDRKHMYRVKLEWVTNEGWKPTLVEQLKS
jgi:cytoskeletal protein RodZ